MITNEQILGMKTIAYTHRGFLVVMVKGFINTDERVLFVTHETYGGGKSLSHNTKLLFTTNGRMYFLVKIQGRTHRFYLDELVRFS